MLCAVAYNRSWAERKEFRELRGGDRGLLGAQTVPYQLHSLGHSAFAFFHRRGDR